MNIVKLEAMDHGTKYCGCRYYGTTEESLREAAYAHLQELLAQIFEEAEKLLPSSLGEQDDLINFIDGIKTRNQKIIDDLYDKKKNRLQYHIWVDGGDKKINGAERYKKRAEAHTAAFMADSAMAIRHVRGVSTINAEVYMDYARKNAADAHAAWEKFNSY